MPSTQNPYPYYSKVARGVRKSSELILQEGRSLVINEEDASKYDWSEIPNGSLKVNPKTGIMEVKLEGESKWVPAGIKNDGTICISKDTRIVYEVFTIKEINEANHTFSYLNQDGQMRHSVLLVDEATGTREFVFEVETLDYMMMRNMLNVKINDTLIRSQASGGLREITNKRFSVYDDLHVDDEITVCYGAKINIGNPYPRIYISDTPPQGAEDYDLWLDVTPAPYGGKEIVKV